MLIDMENQLSMTSLEQAQSDLIVSLMLAHSMVYFNRCDAPSNYDCFNGGGPDIQNTSESTDSVLQAYIKNLPALAETTAKTYLPIEQARTDAQAVTAPQTAALTSNLYSQYGPQLSSVSDAINAASAQAQAKSDLDVIKGTGRELVNEGLATQKIVDPEYYTNRAAIGSQLTNLVNGLNPNGLSDAERAEVERANNQQSTQRGTLNTPSMTDTIANAMNFGSALQNKQNNISNILSNAGNTLGSLKSDVDAYQVATGKPSRNNLGDSKFNVSSTSSDASNLSNNFLSGVFGNAQSANSANANQKDTLDKIGQATGIVSSL